MSIRLFFKIILLSILVACSDNQEVFLPDYTEIDYLIKNGKIVDGTGNDAFFSDLVIVCLLYTSPSPRDRQKSRMPSSA